MKAKPLPTGKLDVSILSNFLQRYTLLGHRLGKKEIPYLPKDYGPFKLKD